jgi:hypothetical protein
MTGDLFVMFLIFIILGLLAGVVILYAALELWRALRASTKKIKRPEVGKLKAENEQARQTAEYWKANHLAGNAEIEKLKKTVMYFKSWAVNGKRPDGSIPDYIMAALIRDSDDE